MKYTETIRFRVSPAQQVRFKRLAAKMNLSLSCWIRVMLLEASKRKYAVPRTG
jgi:antitoxin component of RelBE/YafQ-DinJ toxin-antitoxin module